MGSSATYTENIYRGSKIHPLSVVILLGSTHNYQCQLMISVSHSRSWFRARPCAHSESSVPSSSSSPPSAALPSPWSLNPSSRAASYGLILTSHKESLLASKRLEDWWWWVLWGALPSSAHFSLTETDLHHLERPKKLTANWFYVVVATVASSRLVDTFRGFLCLCVFKYHQQYQHVLYDAPSTLEETCLIL